MNRLKYRNCWMVAGVIVYLSITTPGQTRMDSVVLKASVSETVALSVSPNLSGDNVRIDTRGDLKALTLTLSGSGPEVAVRVPILIRSNTNYVISALVQSQSVTLANFAVLEVRSTGRFVAQDAIPNFNVARELDSRANGTIQSASLPLNLASPLAVLAGPRVSLAGTLNSTDNALEVTILITVKPAARADHWLLRLTLSGSPGDWFQQPRQPGE